MGNSPSLIGITGGIGSGKSLISRIFNALGVPVYDTDARAKWLMANDLNIKSELIKLLGSESFIEDELNLSLIHI